MEINKDPASKEALLKHVEESLREIVRRSLEKSEKEIGSEALYLGLEKVILSFIDMETEYYINLASLKKKAAEYPDIQIIESPWSIILKGNGASWKIKIYGDYDVNDDGESPNAGTPKKRQPQSVIIKPNHPTKSYECCNGIDEDVLLYTFSLVPEVAAISSRILHEEIIAYKVSEIQRITRKALRKRKG